MPRPSSTRRPRRRGLALLFAVAALLGAFSSVAHSAGSRVAAPAEGSSDPTWYASNRRVAVTSRGRVLVVHGSHLQGVQLKWKDPGEPWRKKTTGRVTDGLLLRGTGTGDWTASIDVARDRDGRQHAWVVWSGWSATNPQTLTMRRLTRLDSPDGPQVGPGVTYERRADGGNYGPT